MSNVLPDTSSSFSSESEQSQKDIAVLEKHALILKEHFDTVHIFATRHEGGTGTIRVDLGKGNWYARFGQIHLWGIKQETVDAMVIPENGDDDV
jgi:hypothetical protein